MAGIINVFGAWIRISVLHKDGRKDETYGDTEGLRCRCNSRCYDALVRTKPVCGELGWRYSQKRLSTPGNHLACDDPSERIVDEAFNDHAEPC